jgi:hypothetical protein
MDQNLKDILETVNFIKDHMLTKEEGVTKDELPDLIRPIIREEVEAVVRPVVRDIVREEISENVRPIVREEITDALKPIEERLTSVESKVSGINRRLDTEAMYRGDLALPKRVSDLEEKTFGASRHPQHLPLK